jgi:exonuclease SbcC
MLEFRPEVIPRNQDSTIMLITRVELENIKSYEEGCFEFASGVTAISGPNGAGKTTILEAIAWALFDHLPYKKEDFLRRGARKGSARVTFESALDSREYTVYRDTGSGFYVYDPITKMRLVEQKSQVIAWIKQHIGVEPTSDLKALFTSTIGVPQGAFTLDFADQPAKRKIGFDKVLRVEEYTRSSDELRDLIKLIEGRDIGLREEMARVEVEAAALDHLLIEDERNGETIEKLSRELKASEARRDCLRQELERMGQLQKKIESLTRDRQTLGRRKTDLEARKEGASESVTESRRACKIVEATADGFEVFNEASLLLAELEKQAVERDSLRAKHTETERQLIRIEAAHNAETEKLAAIESARLEIERLIGMEKEQSNLESERGRLQEEISRLTALKAQAELADRELGTFRREFSELSRQIEEAEKYRAKAERVPSLEEERRRTEAHLRELQVNDQRLKDRRRELVRAEENISRLGGEIKTLEKELAACRLAQRAASQLPEIEKENQEIIEEIAALKINIERETRLIGQIKGGLCPLLDQQCRNMKEGEGLDQYFKIQAGQDRGLLEKAEQRRKDILARLAEARSAHTLASVADNNRAQLQRAGQELEIQQSTRSRLKSEIESISLSQELLSETKEKLDRLDSELREAQIARGKYATLDSLRLRKERLKVEGTKRRQDFDDMKKLIEEMGGLPDEMAEVERRIVALDDPRARCRLLRESLSREPDIRQSAQSLEREKSQMQSALESLGDRLASFDGLDQRIQRERDRRAASEKDHRLHVSNKPLAALLKSREEELTRIETDLSETARGLAAVEKEMEEDRALYDEERHKLAVSEYEAAIARTATLASEIEAAQQRAAELAQKIGDAREAKRQVDRLREERDRCASLLSLSEFIRDVLKKAGPYITEAHLQSISIEANQLYRDITGNPMVSLRWDAGYEVILEEDGFERPFASLSGGEQMAAALAVRLAMLKELSEMRVAFFDEPTANMDEERRRNLAQQIGRIRDFDQLFVISHDDAFEGATDQSVAVGKA